jgi:hypothetical protein
MLAAPVIPLDSIPQPRRSSWAPLGLSLALHLLLALAWLGFPLPEPPPDEPALQVVIARAPPSAPGKATDASEAVEPTGRPGEAKPIPQLAEGGLAAKSSPPVAKTAPSPPQPHAATAVAPKKAEPVLQSERDFVLSQVLRHWHPPRELAAYERADVAVAVVVDAQGFFDDAYDARRPWNPGAVYDGYQALHPQSLQRRAIDAFYQAIRKAQPVRLPPALKAKAPFPIRLDFRFKDAR